MKCPLCGITNNDQTTYCDYCGTYLEENNTTQPKNQRTIGLTPDIPQMSQSQREIQYPLPQSEHIPTQDHYRIVTPPLQCKKKPILAAILSLFPGLGQVYNGNFKRGLYFFIATVLGLIALILPGIIIWLFGIYDAYQTTHQMNAGRLPCIKARVAHIGLFVVGAPILTLCLIVILAIAFLGILTIVNPGMNTAIQSGQDGLPRLFVPAVAPNCGVNFCPIEEECCNGQCFNVTASATHTQSYSYLLRGKKGSINLLLYDDLNDIYSPKKGARNSENISEFYRWYLNQSCQAIYLSTLLQQITNISSNQDDQLRIAVSLIQHIPYDEIKAGERRDILHILPTDEHGLVTINNTENASVLLFERYPYNVLYEKRGICSDKSITLAFLLRELGYGVVLFQYSNESHIAVGVKCPPAYSHLKTGYCFIETTNISIITDSSGTYGPEQLPLTSMPQIIDIADGRSFESVREEFNDLQELKKLIDRAEQNNNQLYAKDFDRFLSLKKKYGV